MATKVPTWIYEVDLKGLVMGTLGTMSRPLTNLHALRYPVFELTCSASFLSPTWGLPKVIRSRMVVCCIFRKADQRTVAYEAQSEWP